jgi:hypothetical protein
MAEELALSLPKGSQRQIKEAQKLVGVVLFLNSGSFSSPGLLLFLYRLV